MKKLTLPHWKNYLIFPDRLFLSLSILGFAATSGVLFAITEKHEGHSTKLLTELNSLQKNMASLQKTVNKPLPQIDLNSTNKEILKVSQQLELIRTKNLSHFDESLNKTETKLTYELEAIKQLVSHLDSKQQPIKFLTPKDLPFKVVSLDSIQHIPVASIAYDFKTIPLEKDDSLSGWRVISLDYGKQQIEFENSQKEHVLLTHEHIG